MPQCPSPPGKRARFGPGGLGYASAMHTCTIPARTLPKAVSRSLGGKRLGQKPIEDAITVARGPLPRIPVGGA